MRAIVFVCLNFCTVACAQTSWTGLLVDAGCRDRSLENLLAPPAQEIAQAKPPVNKVPGISVSPQTIKVERGREALPDTLDHASRYSSVSCAITADTSAFALLLLPKGPLLDLDAGGNTFALESFQSTPAGRAILNGKTGGLKPRATVKGLRQRDTLKAQSVVFSASNP